MKSPKVTKKIIEQEIDLGEIFGIDATDSPALKEALGQAIIDRITQRTEAGKGLKFTSGGNASEIKLKSPYSQAYVKSREFKAAGKKASEITMELTGDMLAAVDVVSTSGNKIKVAITDELQVLKAFNHITGDTVPERPWFGISKDELKDIGIKFKSDLDALQTKDLVTPRQQRLLDLLDTIRGSAGKGVVTVDETTE
jgi:hypothetical protein